MSKEVVLTGLRSNGELHLGNYLGAILPMIELQKKYGASHQFNMFVPDLHSFITPVVHSQLYQNSLENLKVYVAAGLDFESQDTFIYRQSYIPAHSELTWILSCFTYFGELNRMTQFKDKGESQNDQINAGLFTYPVLMAADIVLYDAQWVPVGEDQRQHLELARDVAIRMNNKFGNLFKEPNDWSKQLEFAGRGEGVRIRSLRNPEKKMSKSIEDPAGTISLSDNPKEAAKKVLGATTDSVGVINYDFDKQPGISNLIEILALLTSRSISDVTSEWSGKTSYGELKQATASAVEGLLVELQTKLASVDSQKLINRLEESEAAMANIANNKLLQVQKAVGLRPK